MSLEIILPAIAVTLAFIVFIFQIADSKAEYSARSFIINYLGAEWWLHNDEKTILAEARSIYLRNVIGAKISDFGPWPVSAGFGIVSTVLNLIGFYIFGFNAAGFRFFYIIFSFAANILFILSFFNLLSGVTAFLASLFLLLNYRFFLAGRHAYPENILTFILALFIFIFSVDPLFLKSNLSLFAFFSGAAILIKPNYPVYIYMMLGSVFLAVSPELSEFFRLSAFSFAGLIIFELFQLMVLYSAGTVRLRVQNFCAAIKQHRGCHSVNVLVKSFPDGIKTSFKYLDFFMDWFEIPSILKPLVRILAVILFVTPIFLYFFTGCAAENVFALFLLHLFFLAFSSLFFFYLKRAYSWFPVTLLLFSISAECILKPVGPWGVAALNILLLFFLAIFIARQFYRLKNLEKIRMPSLKNAAAELEKLIPDGSIVYAHCFAYRYFWQSEKLRMKSCDDQLMDNEKIIEWALRENGEYLLLSSRDSGIDALKYRNVEIKPLQIFHSSPVATDYPENYILLRISNRIS